jgi:hypothetical protein
LRIATESCPREPFHAQANLRVEPRCLPPGPTFSLVNLGGVVGQATASQHRENPKSFLSDRPRTPHPRAQDPYSGLSQSAPPSPVPLSPTASAAFHRMTLWGSVRPRWGCWLVGLLGQRRAGSAALCCCRRPTGSGSTRWTPPAPTRPRHCHSPRSPLGGSSRRCRRR